MPQMNTEIRKAYNKMMYQKNKCEHGERKATCVECGGSSICEHKKQRYRCVDCGGVGTCEHGKRKSRCVECGGAEVCGHARLRLQCRECMSAPAYLLRLQRKQMNNLLKMKRVPTNGVQIAYLDCSAEYFIGYVKRKMTPGMTFANIHIDHIKPVSAFELDDPDDFLACSHYSNIQPLTAAKNMQKSAKWSSVDEAFWQQNIKGEEYIPLYIPTG